MLLARRALPALLFASLGVTASVRAGPWAPKPPLPEGDTLEPYVYGGTIYNSNPFLVPNKAQAQSRLGTTDTSDLIVRAGTGLDMAWPIGLQKLRLAGWVERNQYQHFNALSHTAYDAQAGWDWAIGRLWRGTVAADYSRTMATFEEFQNVDKNMVSTRVTSADAGLRFLPDWEWVVGALQRKTSFDKESDLDRLETTGFTEVHYDSPVHTRMGLRAEITDGNVNNDQLQPDGTVDSSDYTETQYSVVLGYEGSEELSYLTGRFGYTQRKFKDSPGRDFSGPTARLSYLWRLTDITALRLSGWRELQSQDNEITNYLVSWGVSLEPRWQATDKIRVRGHYSFQDRVYKGGDGTQNSTNVGRKDQVYTASLGMDYEALPNLYLSMEATYETRNSNRDLRDFEYERVSAGVSYTF